MINMNEPYPFDQQWFKDMSVKEKCRWLQDDAKNRPPAEFKVVQPELKKSAAAYIIPPAFDAPQNPPTILTVNPEARQAVIDLLKSNIELEIALPTFRAYRMGVNVRHSAFSIISLAHAKTLGFEPQEVDKVIIDEIDGKYQFHYNNLHDALRWALGSDNPVVPESAGLPLTSLRELLCMTKKSNKRSKLKFVELIDLLERT